MKLQEWQSKMLTNPNVRVKEFLAHYGIDKISKMDEFTFKHSLSHHTKFSYDEQCQFWMDKVFECVYYVDYSNPDLLSHFLIYDDGEYWVFENKMGRASYCVYRLDHRHIEYDDRVDKYTFIANWKRQIETTFYIRLYDVEFAHQFLENILDRRVEFKKDYVRSLKRNEKLKNILK
jgi:hypothetical protein